MKLRLNTMKNLKLNPMKNTAEIINDTNGSQNTQIASSMNTNSILSSWGFAQAGQLSGSIKGLNNSIEIVYNNYINEASNNKGEKQANIEKQIDSVNGSISAVVNKISTVKEVKIPEQRNIMEDYKNEIDEVNTKAGEEHLKSNFSWAQTIMATFFAVILGLALFTFYTSLVYSSLFKDFGSAIQGATVNNFSMLFNSLFDITVFKDLSISSVFSFILASVFTAIAFAMHKLWENKNNKWRYFHVLVIALVALVMEVFFAVKLEMNIYELKTMTGQAEYGLSTWDLIFTVDVAIVLILGFVSYIIWSIILKLTFNEWEKRNYKRLAVLKAIELNKKINRAKYKISEFNNDLNSLVKELENLQLNLKKLHISLNNAFFNVTELDSRLTEFFQGWLRYIKINSNLKDQVEIHNDLFEERKKLLINMKDKIAA